MNEALAFYDRFLRASNNLAAPTEASEEEVLGIWADAGYYRRARNLHCLAKEVVEKGFPKTYAGLLKLPGIGPYTAAAVASVAFGELVAVVDGNVRRVLARLFAVENPQNRWLQETAQALLEPASPGTWNQALMELGSLLCTPKDPGCGQCPVASFCAGRTDSERYPAPKRGPSKLWRPWPSFFIAKKGPFGVAESRDFGWALGSPPWGRPQNPAKTPFLVRLRPRRVCKPSTPHTLTHERLSVEIYAAFWEGNGDDPGFRPFAVPDHKILRL